MTTIGVHPWEQETPQALHLDLSYPANAEAIAETDSLALAIDYEKILECILLFVKDHRFKLIETLAVKIADKLQTEFQLKWINLTLHKPGALLNAKDVAITVVRPHMQETT